MNIIDIAKATAPNAKHKIIGIRPGEKLHEQMIGLEDALYTFEHEKYFKILPAIHGWSNDPLRIKDGKKVPCNFSYTSDNNEELMSVYELKLWIEKNKKMLGNI